MNACSLARSLARTLAGEQLGGAAHAGPAREARHEHAHGLRAPEHGALNIRRRHRRFHHHLRHLHRRPRRKGARGSARRGMRRRRGGRGGGEVVGAQTRRCTDGRVWWLVRTGTEMGRECGACGNTQRPRLCSARKSAPFKRTATESALGARAVARRRATVLAVFISMAGPWPVILLD